MWTKFLLLSLSALALVAAQDFVDSESSKESKNDLSEELKLKIGEVPELGFNHGFLSSLSVILVSEIGDKTFFIAAIMAMKYSRLTIFTGAILALATMTVMSVLMGALTTIIPRYITFYVSTALFALFGLKMLKEGFDMKADSGLEEMEEVQQELKEKDEERERKTGDIESQGPVRASAKLRSCFSAVFLQAFTMTFLAEWGDRSQLTTIILGAREDILGVIVGGILGHSICTGMAVVGGRLIATKISVRTVTIIGGVVFLIFALSAVAFQDMDELELPAAASP
jgi:putative Ca2+/H+ antiporter (TMEM165/GDT1 family)